MKQRTKTAISDVLYWCVFIIPLVWMSLACFWLVYRHWGAGWSIILFVGAGLTCAFFAAVAASIYFDQRSTRRAMQKLRDDGHLK